MKSLKETLQEALQETLPGTLANDASNPNVNDEPITEAAFPAGIHWIVDRNPIDSLLEELGFDEDMDDMADEIRNYKESKELDKACKKFKLQPNNLQSAEDLIIVLDRFAGFVEAADLDSIAFSAAQILNLLHREYEKVFDENTKVITKLKNMPVDEYSKIKNAPLRVIVAALEKYCSETDSDFDDDSNYVDTARDIVQDYLTNG